MLVVKGKEKGGDLSNFRPITCRPLHDVEAIYRGIGGQFMNILKERGTEGM